MINFRELGKNWHSWFLAGNLLVALLLTLQMLERIFCAGDYDCVVFGRGVIDLLSFRQLPAQTSYELIALTLVMVLIVGRMVSAMAAFFTSYNLNDDETEWLSEDEYNQKLAERSQHHRQLAASVVQTIAVLVCYYLVMLLSANVYVLLLCLVCSWFLSLASIRALRGNYRPPGLSTFEFACTTKITRILGAICVFLLLLILMFFSLLAGKQSPGCVDLGHCLAALSGAGQSIDLSGFDSISYMLHFLVLGLSIWLVVIFSGFRAGVLSLYRRLLLLSVLLLIVLPVVELVYQQAFVRVALSLYCLPVMLLIFLFLLFDVRRFVEADSIARRKDVVQRILSFG